MYLLRGFEDMLIRGKCGKWRNFGVFDTIFPSEIFRNLHFLHKNNAIVAKPRESGKRISGAIWSKSY